MRRKLPERRHSELVDFVHEGIPYHVMASRYGDGKLAEIFIDAGKPGAPIDIMGRDAALVLSIALQHGVPVEEIKAALSQERDGTMRGPVGVALELLGG